MKLITMTIILLYHYKVRPKSFGYVRLRGAVLGGKSSWKSKLKNVKVPVTVGLKQALHISRQVTKSLS